MKIYEHGRCLVGVGIDVVAGGKDRTGRSGRNGEETGVGGESNEGIVGGNVH